MFFHRLKPFLSSFFRIFECVLKVLSLSCSRVFSALCGPRGFRSYGFLPLACCFRSRPLCPCSSELSSVRKNFLPPCCPQSAEIPRPGKSCTSSPPSPVSHFLPFVYVNLFERIPRTVSGQRSTGLLVPHTPDPLNSFHLQSHPSLHLIFFPLLFSQSPGKEYGGGGGEGANEK